MARLPEPDGAGGPPIGQACYWLATAPPTPPRPALAGSARADIAIVGGGLTGLWTALALAELAPAARVVLVEQEVVAYGASGRNAGMVGETVDHSHALAIRHFGLAEARQLAALGRQNLDEMAAFLAAEGIDAGFTRPGQLFVALTPAHTAGLDELMDAAHAVGSAGWQRLSQAETRDELASPLYLGGVLAPVSGLVDPARLVQGLAEAAERRGVVLHEHSPVTRIERAASGARIATTGGELLADRVVLATNAYSRPLLTRLGRRFLPLYDYIVVTRPLPAAAWERLGWRRRCGVTDLRTFFNYYRPTADGRILWGTSEAVYHPRGAVGPACDHSPAHYASLRASFDRHFPELAGFPFDYAWGGPIAATTRFTPFFGRALGGRLSYGLGYTGHGVGSTRIAGKILAHLALDRPSPWLDLKLVRRPPLPYPPEPFRGLAIAAVGRGLRRVDAGASPSLFLRLLDRLGIGFSS